MPKKTAILDFEEFVDDNVKELAESLDWMKDCQMKLCMNIEELRNFVDKAIERGLCALDLETTGLNTRIDKVKGPLTKIVGISLAYNILSGIYIPINHTEGIEYNLNEFEVFDEINRLKSNCVIIVHNGKFDFQVLKNFDILIYEYDRFEDTLILARLYDAGQKEIGLKVLSENLLNKPMIDFDRATGGSKQYAVINPKIAVTYAVSDAICTLCLYEYFMGQDTVIRQQKIYNLEKRLVSIVMQMESNLIKIDRKYLIEEQKRIYTRMKEIELEVFKFVGREFNISSSQQVGKILFDELKFEYPEKEKTASGQYKTSIETLEKLTDKPIVNILVEYRKLDKFAGTYIHNLIHNCDEDECIKLSFNQTGTDTGRFSSPGGKGIDIDGYSAVNVQSIPANYSTDVPDIRKAMIARMGFKIVAMDFSGEELRVAANLSRERKWIEEFLHGSADLHTATAKAIFKKENIEKAERQLAKTCNFLSLYGGGPRGLAQQAKISEREAKRILVGFFEGLPDLSKWIELERKRARRLKYAMTSFGRIRPLHMFYDSGDRGLEAHADRCATNFLVQGCLQENERVLTTSGYLPIQQVKLLKEIHPLMKVWTGTSWEDFDVLERGDWQYATIELHNGMKLKCDTRHEVLTIGVQDYQFTKFEDLTEDSMVCVSLPIMLEYGEWPEYPKTYYEPTVYNWKAFKIFSQQDWIDIAYLMGYIIGDGTVQVNVEHSFYAITFNFGKQKLEKHYEFIKNKLESFGVVLSDSQKSKGSKGESYRAVCYSISFIELLKEFGYDFIQKRIPSKIFNCPLAMRKAFLKGYFDTDGTKYGRFNFHTPNRELLEDIQLLGWSLGCASRICTDKAGAHLLNWESMQAVTMVLGVPCPTKYKYRGRDMILPKFLHQEVLSRLEEKRPHTKAEIVLLSKLRTGKNVSTQSMVQFLRSKQADVPTIYYYYRVKSKTVEKHTGPTYTLAVHSPLHRFDSAGIISKNTCADIMKVVMVQVSNWIAKNNLQDDIRILITMHDELVYEMREDRLAEFIPTLNNIMCLRSLLQGKNFNWPVPLSIDAEYGDTWHVDHDFFKEHPEMLEMGETVEFRQPTQITVTTDCFDKSAPRCISVPPTAITSDCHDLKKPESPSKESPSKESPSKEPPSKEPPSDGAVSNKLDEPLLSDSIKGPETKDPIIVRLSSEELSADIEVNGVVEGTDEFIYILRNLTKSTGRKLNNILEFLKDEYTVPSYTGNLYRLRLRDRKGNALLVSDVKVRPDSFLSLARYFGV